MKPLGAIVLALPAVLCAQLIPVRLGPSIAFLPPAVDASGRAVLLASSVDPNSHVNSTIDLYVAAPDGSGRRRLTDYGTGNQTVPQGITELSLSRAGTQATVVAILPGNGAGTWQVHLIDTSTGSDRAITVDTQGCVLPLGPVPGIFSCIHSPHFTPDGKRIVFSVNRTPPFMIVNSDGAGLARLPFYSGTLAPGPQRVISRDGRIVFSSSAPSGPTFAASATDVYIANLDGTALRNLTNFGNNSQIFTRNASISDDGRTVVFESNFAGAAASVSRQIQIWAVQSDGTGLRQLTTGNDQSIQPSLSTDGSTIAFAQSGQIYVLKTDGRSTRTAVTAFQLSTAQDPVISDDGSLIAFVIGPRGGGSGAIYSVKPDGTNLHAVYAPRTISPNGMVSPVFSFPPSLGSLITVYGTNLNSDRITSAEAFPLPEDLAGLRVLVNGRSLPIVSVTPWQVNAQAPQDLPTEMVNLQLAFSDGNVTPPIPVNILASAPVPFMYQRPVANGQPAYFQIAAFHAGTGVAADDEHPAAPNEILEMFGIGLGVTRPQVPGGAASPANPPARARFTPEVLIGGQRARVPFAGLVPGLAGIYQVNVVVPAGLKPGRQPVIWQTRQFRFAGPGTISVR